MVEQQRDKVAVARPNSSGGLTFFLDSNGNRSLDALDESYDFGLAGDFVVVGDWDGGGTDDVGVARSNGSGGLTYFLDSNGSRFFEGFRDSTFDFGLDQHRIAVGDWDGNGIDGVGVVQPRGDMGSNVVQDVNENQLFDATDELFTFDFGLPDDLLLAGYWRHTAALQSN